MSVESNRALSIAIGSVTRLRKDIELSNEEKNQLEEEIQNRVPGSNDEASEIMHVKQRIEEVCKVLENLNSILPEYEDKLRNLLRNSNDYDENLMNQAKELLK